MASSFGVAAAARAGLFFGVGALSLIAFGIWEFVISSEPEWYYKIAISAVAFGFLSLFISVLRQRMVALKTDRYQDVQI